MQVDLKFTYDFYDGVEKLYLIFLFSFFEQNIQKKKLNYIVI